MSSHPRSSAVALSIVIPAYREAARLPANLARIAEFLRRTPLPGVEPGELCEVLVVVEKSDDDTLARCRAAAAMSLRPGEDALSIEVIDNVVQRGKGHAVRSGMLRARGAIALFMDADLSTPLATIPLFLAHFAAHPETDVLIGNRRHPAARLARRQGWLRRRLGGLFSTLVRAVSGGDALLPPAAHVDTQCGFKAFRQSAAREIFSRQRLDGFSFDVEVLALAAALQMRVEDLPVDWENSPGSTLRLVQDGWTMLRDLVVVRTLVRRTLREQPGPRSSRSDVGAAAETEIARDREQTHV